MPLNKDARMKIISNIKKQTESVPNSLRIEIPWKDRLEVMIVCQVPLNCLVYNSLNGRILSRTQSLETQNRRINAEEDGELIEDLLWNSTDKNENTLSDINKLGQQKIGIITKDGVVVDGNRRVMLLNELKTKRHTKHANKLSKTYDYFKAVVLTVTKDEDLVEIEKLEISYQLGEDQKIDYNPIELYLKIQRQYKTLAEKPYKPSEVDNEVINTIHSWIGNYKTIEKKEDIEFFLLVMNTMDDYLEYFGYEGIYLALDKREEQFRRLTSWIKSFREEKSSKAFSNYREQDVDDLVNICFDLIRYKLQNMEFRKIGQGQKGNHFFGNKDIWSKFSEKHFKFTKTVKDEEKRPDYNAQNLENHINDRDRIFLNNIKTDVEDNIETCENLLKNKKNQDKPNKLINEAYEKLRAVNPRADSFSKSDTQRQLKVVASEVTNLLFNNISLILEQSFQLLNKINLEDLNSEDNDKRLKIIIQINKLSFEMKKQLGG